MVFAELVENLIRSGFGNRNSFYSSQKIVQSLTGGIGLDTIGWSRLFFIKAEK